MSLDVKKDPFYATTIRFGGGLVSMSYWTTEERIYAIQNFDAYECHAALARNDLQTTVRKALEARLRTPARAMP